MTYMMWLHAQIRCTETSMISIKLYTWNLANTIYKRLSSQQQDSIWTI